MKKSRDEILKYVNGLAGYDGYIQLMGEKIDEEHIFFAEERSPSLSESELIYEAHFFSSSQNKSIFIRQINDGWFVDETDLGSVKLGEDDVKVFYAKSSDIKIKMAQIWVEESDELCEGLPVLKFKKSAFAGFIRDKKDEK